MYGVYVVGISKKHTDTGKRRHYKDGKRHYVLYFYDENGVFRTKRLTFFEAIWKKMTVRKYKKVIE